MSTNNSLDSFKIILANPRGFCAGVDRAVLIVEKSLELYGPPIYVKHEIVHNKFVVDKLKAKGVIFVDSLDAVPPKSRLIFSAHGVSPAVREEAKLRGFELLDATCPLVLKVHKETTRFAVDDYKIILIGHKKHVEVIGTVGHAPDSIEVISSVEEVEKLNYPPDCKLAFITQTTLSVYDTAEVIKALKKKFPWIKSAPKDDICYATTNRQQVVNAMCEFVDTFLVVGSFSSSNTNRLVETAKRRNRPSYLIEKPADVDPAWLKNISKLGITAGASAPEELVQAVVKQVLEIRFGRVEEFHFVDENVEFPLPFALRKLLAAEQ